MAQSLHNIEVIIKKTYALQVAVRCTTGAEAVCKKNNLTFCDLLEPFSLLSSQVQLKDVQGHPYTLKNIHVRFSEPQLEPIPDVKLHFLLGDVVKRTVWEGKQPLVHYGSVTTCASTPWYDSYRSTFLERIKQGDHEPIRHYVSVMLVVSSNEPDVKDAFSRLYTSQREAEQAKNSKWLAPHVFYYHVLLHDVMEGDSSVAQDNLAKIQATYGEGSCYLLPTNSRQPGTVVGGDNPWSRVASRLNTSGTDEPDGRFKLKFSIGQKKNRKSPKISREVSASNHTPSPPPITDTSSSSSSTTTTTAITTTLSSSPPSSTITTPLPTDFHPLAEVETETISPNVREEARLVESGSEESLPEVNQSYSSSSSGHMTGGVGWSQLEGGAKSLAVGECLSADDESSMENFVSEFLGQRLLPHLEAVVRNLNEWLLSRRSVRRSISYMGKRFLGILGGQLNNAMADEPSYSSNSLEFQMRQFGDLAFLLQNYDLAFQTYSSVKKDFHSSSAWMHYAGAVEMYAVTAYMLSATRREVLPYLEEAISVFTLSCKAPLFALRCSMLLSEVLKERGLYRDLTQVFIKMTAEDSDLRSAVCLEQAAHAFLRIHPAMVRKYALHLILAGHRYAKANQRVHSARVYTQALEVYRGRGWALAEDYIHFSLARHSFSLQRLRDAQQAFEQLLGHESPQTPSQQLLNLKEYIYVHKLLLSDTDYCSGQQVSVTGTATSITSSDRVQSVPLLPVPFVNASLTRAIFSTGVKLPELQDLILGGGAGGVGVRRGGGGGGGEEAKRMELEGSGDEEEEDGGREEGEQGKEEGRKGRARSLSSRRLFSLIKQLDHGGGSSQEPLPLIIGAKDFNPSQIKGTAKEWRKLEKIAARGPQGTPRENFCPSVVVMDQNSNNCNMPLCVVNEPVCVGVVLRNPLKIPVVMRRVALTWQFSAHSNEDGGGEGARCEVVERVVLQPQAEKMVMLRITPLREGELDVLGFIYNLCIEPGALQKGSDSPQTTAPRSNLPSLAISSRDTLYQRHQNSGVQESLEEGVQGRVEFNMRGPRLNHTKEHKSGVVYGPDHRLQWVVTTPMPKVVVSISNLPSTVLSSEVCRVRVEAWNCGQVPLNSLRLTSSFKRRLLMDTASGSIYPSAPSPVPPTTVSFSPSHLSSPRTPPPCIELPLPGGRLEPGKGVAVGVVMQTVDPQERGEVPWNLLLYYEPTLINANSKISHRVLQYSHVMKVKESLILKTSATPGQIPARGQGERFDLNQLVITLEAENKCQLAVEMRILQLSCISRRWSIHRMDQHQSVLALSPNEAGIISLKASRNSHSSANKNVCFSDVALGPTTIPSNLFPTMDLLCASEAYQCLSMEEEELENERGGEDRGGEERAVGGKDRSDIVLVVFWQALVPHGADILYSYGHHTTSVRLPQSMTVLNEPPPSAPSPTPPHSPYDLVKHCLDHPSSFTHDFSTAALCQVPVVLTLQNCCHCAVQVILEFAHHKDLAQDSKTTGSKHTGPDTNVVWSGGTCQRHLKIASNSVQTVRVYANFSKAGVYNMHNVKVWATLDGSTNYHIQRWQRTSLISIAE